MKRGFSLVELSIVLVILGLLTGGIVAGKSLIRASELRAVMTERDRYITAIASFRDKYLMLPGDMSNATKFWGSDTGCPVVAYNTTPKTATCDGNGDGKILSTSAGYYTEVWRSWQQLANAGLIEGSYTGTCGQAAANCSTGANVAQIGLDVPTSKLDSVGVTLLHLDDYLTAAGVGAWYYSGSYGHVLAFGQAAAGGHFTTNGGILVPEEAWNIDTKLDDGKPGLGKMRIRHLGFTSCGSTTTASTAEYVLTTATKACLPLFLTGL